MQSNRINIIGAPFNCDGTKVENENPSQSLRDCGLIKTLEKYNFEVIDNKDIDIFPADGLIDIDTGILNFKSLLKTSENLSSKILETYKDDYFQLILGGDCSILIGIFNAFHQMNKKIGLVFLDGHADFHSMETSTTHEAADFELAILTGRKKLLENIQYLKDSEVVAFGLSELDLIEQSEINFYTVDHLRLDGIEGCINEGLSGFKNNEPLWLHFDVDVIDSQEMPVIFPTKKGLTLKEVNIFLSAVLKKYNIIGLSISCYHPNLDPDLQKGRELVSLLENIKYITSETF